MVQRQVHTEGATFWPPSLPDSRSDSGTCSFPPKTMVLPVPDYELFSRITQDAQPFIFPPSSRSE